MTTIQMMRQILAHPLDFFHDIKKPNQLRWSQGFLLIILAFFARMVSLILVSYHFEKREAYEISYIFEFVWIFVPWLTWCVGNWSVSAILDGEGKFKEIFIGTACCLTPYILFIIPISLLTNVITLNEASIYNFTTMFIFAWVGLLILIKVKVLHDFELGKLTLIIILTLLAVGIIWFIGILLYGLLSQFLDFFFDIFKELRFRV